MDTKSDLEYAHERFMVCHGKEPGALELRQAWEAMVEKPRYASFVRGFFMLAEGHDPKPDLAPIQPLLRRSGHELAAMDVLKPSNVFRQALAGRGACRENYQGLQLTLVASLLDSRRALEPGEIEVLYSTMDRLLRGGREWTQQDRVPTADRKFYLALWNVKLPLMHRVAARLNSIIEVRGTELFGAPYKDLCNAGQAAQDFLAVAIAVKYGHKVVTLRDAFDGAWTYASLFDVDLHTLPLVVREGRSGYEKDAS